MYIGPNSRNPAPDENPHLDELIDALRGEMLQYSGLLVMLREQEKHILGQQPADIVASAGQMSEQLTRVANARNQREKCMQSYISELDEALLKRQLSSQALGNRRRLLTELIAQINNLLHEIQDHLKRNHDLLVDTLIPHQKILDRILWN